MTTLAPNLIFMPTDHDFMELVWEKGQILIRGGRGRGWGRGRGRGRGGGPSDGNTKSSSITTPSSTPISSANTCKLQENTKNIERFQTMESMNHPLDISRQEYCDYSPDLCDQANLNAPRSLRNDIAETEKFKSSDHKMSAVGRSNPVEPTVLIVDSAGGGSESVVIGLKKSQSAALMAAKVYSRPSLANILEDNPLSDDHRSKVVVCQEDAIRNNISPNRATLGFTVIEGKPNTQQTTIDPTDSSVCSHGASNAPNYTMKRKHQQQTKDSENHAGEYCERERPEHAKMKKTVSARGSTYAKRNRVHNLSERRQRDKINKKMRTLQDLIPNCSKGDKASVLDEAIDYLKTLQLQLQIMSMGSGMYMAPPMMMLPLGMHLAHCSPMVTAGTGMGMGMGHHLHNQHQWPISQSLPRGPHQV